MFKKLMFAVGLVGSFALAPLSVAEDDFFDLLRSALDSVGVIADEYPQRATIFVDSPRIANLGHGDWIDYAVVDLGGKGSGDAGYLAELIISFPVERLIPGEGPLQVVYQKNALQEIHNELMMTLAASSHVEIKHLLVDPHTSGIRFLFGVPRGNVLTATQEVLSAILEARQMMRELALGGDAGACDTPFSTMH